MEEHPFASLEMADGKLRQSVPYPGLYLHLKLLVENS